MKQTERNNPVNGRLFHKDFLLVVIGQIISLFGNAILRFALPLYILQSSGSPALFGLVSASAFLPMVIMSPVGGIIADRVNKQRIMVYLDFITAALIGIFMLLNGRIDIVPLVVVMLMLLYAIQGAYSPAVQASIPLLADGEHLVQANAVVNLVQSLSGLLGPVIGGILFGRFGLEPIILVSCICFAFSAILELFIHIPHQKLTAEKNILTLVKKDMKESLHFIVKKNPIIARAIIMIFCINLFMSSMIIIGMPVIITEVLGLSNELYGISEGVLAAGGLLGGIAAGTLSKRLRVDNSYLLLVTSALGIVPMGIVLFFSFPALVCYLVLTIMGAFIMVCSTIFSIQLLALVQAQTPTAITGKVISCIFAISTCSQPIGQALYGILFEHAGAGLVVLLTAIISFAIALFSKSSFGNLRTVLQAD